jgi:hypothetical protein
MNDILAGGAVAIISAIAGAATTYVLRRQEKTWTRAAVEIRLLCQQVADYYEVERILLERLSESTGEPKNNLKIEARDLSNVDRGNWLTANGARKMEAYWDRHI